MHKDREVKKENRNVNVDETRIARNICSALYLFEQTGTITVAFAFENVAALPNMHDLTSPRSLPFDLLICY